MSDIAKTLPDEVSGASQVDVDYDPSGEQAGEDEWRSIFAERAQLLFKNAPIAFACNLVGGVFLLFAFSEYVAGSALLAWFGSLWVVQIARFALYRYRSRPVFADNPRYLVTLSIAGALVSGALWGASVLFLMQDVILLHHTLLVFLLAGLTAATVASSTPFAYASLAFNLPATVPVALYFFFGISDPANIHVIMGVIISLYTVFLMVLARNDEESLILNMRLRLRSAHFLDSLTDERDKARTAYDNLQSVLDTITQGVVVYDEKLRLRAWSQRFVELLNIPKNWMKPGRSMDEVNSINEVPDDLGADGPHDVMSRRLEALAAEIRAGASQHKYERRHPDGTTIEVIGAPLPDGGLVATYTDITAHKDFTSEAVERANRHDHLTGLPNRSLFLIKLKDALTGADRSGQPVSVVLIGLDRFKDVNDSLGLDVGDRILQTVSGRLNDLGAESGLAARLGNDEFAVLEVNKSDIGDIIHSVRNHLDAVSKPIDIDGREVVVTARAGIAMYPNDTLNADELIQYATIALNTAKLEGGQRLRFYDAGTHAEIRERNILEHEMRLAVENGDFDLYYQPLLDTATGNINAVEALMRWNHTGFGSISPEKFIPIAETSGFIIPLTEWALAEAANQVRKWEDQGLPAITAAVNLSPVHFAEDGLVDLVAKTLETTGLAPERLELEITEGMILKDNHRVLNILEELAAMGVGLVVDDFGTGYSSMSYLRKFPIHKMKIDRSFVCDVLTGKGDDAIVEALVTLAHGLNLKVIAEGVETEEQLAYLRKLGCDEVQGFLFTLPLAPDRFVEWARNHLSAAKSGRALATG